jgi:hypothetical protein
VTTSTGTSQVWREDRDASFPPEGRSRHRQGKFAAHGMKILLPGNPAFMPSTEQLTWHNELKYRP